MEALAIKSHLDLDKDISDVLSLVRAIADGADECTVSVKELADEISTSVNHIRRCLDWLRNHGFIQCPYKFLDPYNRDVKRKITIHLLKRQEISL